MLIKDEVVEKIRTGTVTVLFRRWSRPGAKAGGTQMTQGGVVGIDTVEVVNEDEITDADAVAAGYADRDDLIEHLNYREDPIYRIGVRWVGEDPRIAMREGVDDDDIAEIIAKLDKMDRTANGARGHALISKSSVTCLPLTRACLPTTSAYPKPTSNRGCES